jgi:hypothetical protein
VDSVLLTYLGQGQAGLVEQMGGGDVGSDELRLADSARYAVSLEVLGDGGSVDLELGSQLPDGAAGLVVGYKLIDLGVSQAVLNLDWCARWVDRVKRLCGIMRRIESVLERGV